MHLHSLRLLCAAMATSRECVYKSRGGLLVENKGGMNLGARPMPIVLRITCAKWSDTKAKRVIVLNDVDPSQIGDDFGTIYIVMREGPGSLFNSFA